MSDKKFPLWVFVPLALFLGLTVLLAMSLGKDPDLIPSARKGHPVPAFEQPSLMRQNKVITQDIFKGHWSLLNVWATWCPTCHIEHAYLMTLARQGVRIIGMDYKDNVDEARQLLADSGNPYAEVFVDKQGDVGLDLGVYGAPETFVIDPDGNIVMRHVGNLDEDVWRSQILPIWQKEKEVALND